jgi:hypothetical protein
VSHAEVTLRLRDYFRRLGLDHRLRLYESALNNVRYVHGAPLPFDPELAIERQDAWTMAVQDWERREAARRRKGDGGTLF